MRECTIKITRDTCSKDLSPKLTKYPHEYIMKVSVQDVAMHSEYSVIYSLAMRPPIEDDLYFCGLECMTNYKVKKDQYDRT